MKLTEEQAEAKRRQAVEFLNRVGQYDQADEFDEMDADEYAEHRGATIIENPATIRRSPVPNGRPMTKADLQQELDDANDYIEQLEAKLDTISGIAADEEEEEEDDSEYSEEEDDDEYSD